MADNTQSVERFGFGQFIVRLVVSSIILAITAFLTPNFTISGFWPLILGALVISLLDWAASNVTGVNATPFGRGITGFVLAAAVIYFAQFFVSGFDVSFWGAVVGALVYGIVDAIIPGRGM